MSEAIRAVDAAVRFAYNAEFDEFKAALFPKATEGYAMEKYRRMQASFAGFWGALDEQNRERLIEAALDRRARTVRD